MQAVSILSRVPNHFLRTLLPADGRLIAPFLSPVTYPSGTNLLRAESRIDQIYFPYSGIVSITVGLSTGEVVEAGMVGRYGVVGAEAPLADGPFSFSTNNATVQVAMKGSFIEIGAFKTLLSQSDSLRIALARHEQIALAQAQQIAACNAVHGLDQRLCRWLLQARDLLNSDLLPLTHELLAQLLGVHRSSVTQTARKLQQIGLIDYRHGKIRILDVERAESECCECYGVMNAHLKRLIGWEPICSRSKARGRSRQLEGQPAVPSRDPATP